MICDECGGPEPLYYRDTTNNRYACRTCWHDMVDGKRAPRPHMERMNALAKQEPADVQVIKFDDEHSQSLSQIYKEQHEQVEQMVLAFKVDSAAAAQQAAVWAKTITERMNTCVQERDDIAKPLRALATKHASRWNPAIKPLDRCLTYLRKAIADYTVSSRVAAAAALTHATSHTEVQQAAALIAPKAEGVVEVQRWSAEVTATPADTHAKLVALRERMRAHCEARYAGDLELQALFAEWHSVLANALPASFLTVDQSALNRLAVEQHEAFNVPGAKAVRGLGVQFR